MPNRNLADLYPPFANQIRRLLDLCQDRRLPFHLFMGLRTFEEQDELYRQGRTLPGKIVTNARGGESWHQYGMAGDLVLDGSILKPTIDWSWNTKADLNADGRSDWLQMGELAESVGLEWGGRWRRFPDMPHVQNVFGLTINEAQELYRRGGMAEVWRAAGA